MADNKRKDDRFLDIGKVTCPNLCVFSGVLLDVSRRGCRIRFPALLNPNQDKEYELSISLFGKIANQSFLLIAHLQWLCSDKNTTEIGLSFIHSPGTKSFGEYIAQISTKEQTKYEEHNSFMEVDYV